MKDSPDLSLVRVCPKCKRLTWKRPEGDKCEKHGIVKAILKDRLYYPDGE